MENILLALLGFTLGILTTVVTQAILRRWKIADARQRLKLESLQSVKMWMKAYLSVLECKYPNMIELLMPDFYLKLGVEPFDPIAFSRVEKTLKDYRNLQSELIKTEKIGQSALNRIGKKPKGILDRLDRLIYYIRHPRQSFVFTHYNHRHTLYYMNTPGFTRDIAPYLEKLFEFEYKIYEEFPDQYIKINWEKLDYTRAHEIGSIISLQNLHSEERDENLREATNRIDSYKGKAEQEIERILEIILEYESKWLVPNE